MHPTEITASTITLAGVHPAFFDAVQRQRDEDDEIELHKEAQASHHLQEAHRRKMSAPSDDFRTAK